MLKGRKILLGISGGIAVYKIPSLIRILRKAGAEVQVVATRNALQFVTPLTLETLSGRKLYVDVFAAVNDYSTEHIALTDWADALLVAPATANIIGKFAHGLADDALSTSFMAFDKTVLIAPAMNPKMMNNPALIANKESLIQRGCRWIEAEEGELACGYSGCGRMPEPETLARELDKALENSHDLAGKKILITAGPTYEAIDPVRFIGNHSSGRMGIALAEEALERGAEVWLVCGPSSLTSSPKIHRCNVVSAQEMYDQCLEIFPTVDWAILSAAVADYRPEQVATLKIKKKDDSLDLHLVKNPDILKQLGSCKKKNQRLMGFALETDNALPNAQKKMIEKNLDAIVLNTLEDKEAGFAKNTNKVTLLSAQGDILAFPAKNKNEVAKDIIDFLICCK